MIPPIAYAQFGQKKKKDVELAYKTMNVSKRETFISRLSQIEAEEEKQSDHDKENNYLEGTSCCQLHN